MHIIFVCIKGITDFCSPNVSVMWSCIPYSWPKVTTPPSLGMFRRSILHIRTERDRRVYTHWQCRMDTAIRNGPIHLASPNAHLFSAFITCTHPLQVHHQDVALLFHVYYSCICDMQCLKLTSSVHTALFPTYTPICYTYVYWGTHSSTACFALSVLCEATMKPTLPSLASSISRLTVLW